jgi:membrane associated rhomboid family serine protease
MASTVTRGILDFKRIFLIYISVLLTSGIVYAVSQVYPNINSMLSASRSTPWGIITSIFAHSDLSHLAFNMGSLFLLMLLFTFCNSTFHFNSKKRIEMFFLVSIFMFAIISNILWIVFRPDSSIGASGLVYAVEGILVGFSFANGIQVCNFSKFKNQRIPTALIVLTNIAVFAVLFAQILLNPNIFLSVGQGINLIAHGVSFLLGLFASVPWYYLIGKLSILD